MLEADSLRILEDVEAAVRQQDRSTLYRAYEFCHKNGHDWSELKPSRAPRFIAGGACA